MTPGALYEWRDAVPTASEPQHGTFLRTEYPHDDRGQPRFVFEDADGAEFALAAWRVLHAEEVEF